MITATALLGTPTGELETIVCGTFSHAARHTNLVRFSCGSSFVGNHFSNEQEV